MQTSSGITVGQQAPNTPRVTEYLGIPYAQPLPVFAALPADPLGASVEYIHIVSKPRLRHSLIEYSDDAPWVDPTQEQQINST